MSDFFDSAYFSKEQEDKIVIIKGLDDDRAVCTKDFFFPKVDEEDRSFRLSKKSGNSKVSEDSNLSPVLLFREGDANNVYYSYFTLERDQF